MSVVDDLHVHIYAHANIDTSVCKGPRATAPVYARRGRSFDVHHTCIHVRTCVHVAYAHARIRSYAHTRTRVYVYTRIHVHTFPLVQHFVPVGHAGAAAPLLAQEPPAAPP